MKWTTSLVTLILLLTSITALALTPEEQAFIDALKPCTPTDEKSLLEILDPSNPGSKSCWSKDAAGNDQVGVILMTLTDPKTPLVIHLSKNLVLPDGTRLFQFSNEIPAAQFISDFVPAGGLNDDCAITLNNRSHIGVSVDNNNNVTPAGHITLKPGTPTGTLSYKNKALCITGANNVLAGLTIDKNTNSEFLNGIVIEGNHNVMAAAITTKSSGITINGTSNGVTGATITTGTAGIIINSGPKPDADPNKNIDPNIVGKNTIQTSNGCMMNTNGKCTGYAANTGGIVLNVSGNFVVNNTLNTGTPIFFGYDDTKSPIVPVMPIEAAANVLKLNNLSKDDPTVSNYQDLYLGLMGQTDLPKCANDVKVGNVSYTYIYISTPELDPNGNFVKDSKGKIITKNIVSCADGSNVLPECPTLSKVTGKCACTSNKVCSCPAGTKIADGNICVPDFSKQGILTCPEGTSPDVVNNVCIKIVASPTPAPTPAPKNPDTGEVVTLSTEFTPIVANPSSGGGSCSLVPDQVVSALTPVSVFLITIGLTGFTAYRSSVKPQRVRGKTKE